MSDALKPQPSTPVDAIAESDANGSDRDLTPAEIDARHARHLIERALTQLERGERGPAELACRQAIHLAPGASHAHSLAGLLALLNHDVPGARASYEKAVVDFSKASPERERLIALRMAQADQSPVDVSALVPDLGTEILRLRTAIHAASPRDFLPANGAVASGAAAQPVTETIATSNTPIAAPPSPAILTPEARPAFASRLERRRRASAWAVAAAAVSAAVVSFFVMRSLIKPQPAPAPAVTTAPAPTRAMPEPTPTPVPGTPPAGANAASDGNGSTPTTAAPQPTPAPTPSATVSVRPLPPVRVVPSARPTPRPAPRSAPRAIPRAGGTPSDLPAPAVSPRPTARPSARPTPRPEPVFPAMPPPRVTLPSAGGETPDFPRVLPDND